MHGLGGNSGKILTRLDLVEFSGPAILGVFNATNKMGTLLVVRHDGDKNPLSWSHTYKKGRTIPGGMHRMVGPSGNTLPRPELLEFTGLSIMVAFNTTNKVRTLLGGRPDEEITYQ